MLVEPSPKFHCQALGLPVEVSVNCTACSATGEVGLYVKDAISDEAGATLTIWVAVLDPELLLTTSVTLYDPDVEKA